MILRRQFGWGWIETAWLVWIGLTFGIAVYGYCHPASHTVFNIYSPATRRWWAGENIYASTYEFYRYSPLFAVALTPLAYLSPGLGNALWKACCCGFFALGLWAWIQRVLPVRPSRNQTAALWLLALPLSLHSMYIGQANLLIIGAVLLSFAAAVEERWNRAAGWLALATLVKGYPLALALLFTGLYPRRFPLRFLAALAIGLLLPFAASWPSAVVGQYLNWYQHLADSTAIMRERLRSFDYFFVLAGKPLPAALWTGMEVLAGAAIFVLSCWHARQTADPRARLTRVCLLFLTWVALFGPATETCTYVVMAPAIAWGLVDVYRRPSRRLTRLCLGASLLMMGPLVTDLAGHSVRNFANEHASQPIGALLFLAYLLAQTGKRPQPITAEEPNWRPLPCRPAA